MSLCPCDTPGTVHRHSDEMQGKTQLKKSCDRLVMSVTCTVVVQSLILELCGLRSLEVSGVTEERGQPTGRLSLQTHSGAPQMQVGHRGGSLSRAETPKQQQ